MTLWYACVFTFHLIRNEFEKGVRVKVLAVEEWKEGKVAVVVYLRLRMYWL